MPQGRSYCNGEGCLGVRDERVWSWLRTSLNLYLDIHHRLLTLKKMSHRYCPVGFSTAHSDKST